MVAVFLGEMSRGCDISVRILMVILGDLSRGNSKYTTSSGQLRALLRFLYNHKERFNLIRLNKRLDWPIKGRGESPESRLFKSLFWASFRVPQIGCNPALLCYPVACVTRRQMVTELNFNSSFIKTPSKLPARGGGIF